MLKAPCISSGMTGFLWGVEMTWELCVLQEMTLDEYEKLMEEKNANLNKAPPKKSAKARPMKEFEGMTAYTRKVSISFVLPEHAQNGCACYAVYGS